MTRGIGLKSLRVLRALLTCAALSASGALHAQPHTDAEPDLRMLTRAEDQLGREEMTGMNPCQRNRVVDKLEVEWQRLAWLSICVQRARSQVVAGAWDKGLDEYGDPLAADAHSRKVFEMEAWLRRLPGNYGVEGKYWNSGGSAPARGTANCAAIGSGPGVACLIHSKWKPPAEASKRERIPGKDRYLDEALLTAMERGVLLLFGIDPGASRIRATLVDFRAVGMSGFLDDGTVIFQGRPNFENLFSANAIVTYTWLTSLVTTKPGGDLGMKFLVRATDLFITPHPILFDLQLHRTASASAK